MTRDATVREALLALALGCALAVPAAGAGTPGDAAAGISVLEVRFEAGLLTLTAENVTLGEVMQRIGRETGVRFFVPDDIAGERGSWSATSLPLPEALSRIVRPHSMLVMHEPPTAGGAAELRVSEVHLLPSGGAAPARAAPPVLSAPPRPAAPAQSAAAAAAVQAAGAAGDAAGQDDSAQWANTLTRDADATNRRLAVAELERLGSDRAVRALERGIGDRDAEVRIEVIQALGRLGAESSVAVIGRAAIGDRDARVREEAKRVLESDPRESARIFLRQANRPPAIPPAAPAAARSAPSAGAAGNSAIAPAGRGAQPAPALRPEPAEENR